MNFVATAVARAKQIGVCPNPFELQFQYRLRHRSSALGAIPFRNLKTSLSVERTSVVFWAIISL
jgi:hypothetical protein